MRKLAIISSYNPKEYLLDCIGSLKEYFPDFNILVVDSNSNERGVYSKIPNGVDVCFAGNENYELGAYKIGFEKQPNCEVYMCLQDSTIATSSFDLSGINDKSLYVFDADASGFKLSRRKRHKRPTYKMISGTSFERNIKTLTSKRFRVGFRIAKHNLFVASGELMPSMFDSFSLPTNKVESQISERLIALFFTMRSEYNNLIPLKCFKKVHGGRV
jgi:glycosyltransferase involved in cell wall biosynthesis